MKLKLHLIYLLFSYAVTGLAIEVPVYDFPITAYSQETKDYLSPDSPDYAQPLLSSSQQKSLMQRFYNHYFATDAKGLSPWSEGMIRSALPFVKKGEPEIVAEFNNQDKPFDKKHYGENFKEHSLLWLNAIKDNMNLEGLESIEFNQDNRAIALTNTYARALPEEAPDFYHISLPGQSFPFDTLQESAIWAGTPLYVFSSSKDKAWSLVLTPDAYFAWVKSNDIALVSSGFIKRWQNAALRGLIAVTQTGVPILDIRQGFQFTGYIGAVFPEVLRDGQATRILIPFKNKNNHAEIKIGLIDSTASSLMPLSASKRHFAQILNQLKNRPYGWGGLFFLNDCSQELKTLFTPFGIWLPRNSAQMSKLPSTLDLSKEPMEARLSQLKEKGRPLMTLIYIGGHVMLYVDTDKDTPITYQNLWGMAPVNRDKRYVVGQSLFFPLLKQYPENPEAASLADKPLFTLIYLDELVKKSSPREFTAQFLSKEKDSFLSN